MGTRAPTAAPFRRPAASEGDRALLEAAALLRRLEVSLEPPPLLARCASAPAARFARSHAAALPARTAAPGNSCLPITVTLHAGKSASAPATPTMTSRDTPNAVPGETPLAAAAAPPPPPPLGDGVLHVGPSQPSLHKHLPVPYAVELPSPLQVPWA